jgi:hypothetical protein
MILDCFVDAVGVIDEDLHIAMHTRYRRCNQVMDAKAPSHDPAAANTTYEGFPV